MFMLMPSRVGRGRAWVPLMLPGARDKDDVALFVGVVSAFVDEVAARDHHRVRASRCFTTGRHKMVRMQE